MTGLLKKLNLSENDKIVYKNVFGAFLVKGAALFLTLFTLPAYISYFNNDEVLGLWFTLLSLLNWILNFDLGIGNGLRNYLSESISLGKREETKKYISSAYCSIGLTVIVLSVVFPFFMRFIDLNSFLSISKTQVSPKALYTACTVVFVGVMLQFLLKLINSVLYAMQKSSVNNFLTLCTNILTLMCVKLIPSYSNDVNIVVMAFVHALAVAIPLLTASVCIFAGKLKYAIPSIRYVSRKYTKRVLSLGGVFFFIQIAYMVIMSTNEFLITRITGNIYVVDYQAYYKLFSIGSTVFALALTPLWSVVTKAQAEKNYLWIKKTYRKFMVLASLACVCEVFLVVLMKPLMRIWLGADFADGTDYLIGAGFAVLGCMMILCSVFSSIANGTGKLKTQAICYTVGAVIKIPISVAAVELTGSWLGIVVANIVCLGIYCVAQPFVLHRFFNISNR